MKLTNWLSIFYLLLIVACDISIPLPETEVKQVIVANAFFSPDSIWQVQLTKSFALSEADQVELVSNGIVEILDVENRQTIKLTHQQNGIYTATEIFPISNKAYQLTAQVDGFETIQATNQTPLPFIASVTNSSFTNFRNRPSYLFDLQLVDSPAANNFYLIEVTYLFSKNDSLFTEKGGHFSLDANSDNEIVEIDHTALKQSYLPDTNFNGETYSTQIGASSSLLNDLATIDHLTAIINIKSISSEGYQHAKTVETFEFGDSFSSPEPINIFSNIDKGFGVFAGFVSQRIEVKLK